jgi:thioredoxin 1
LKTAEDDVNFCTEWKAKGLRDLSLEITAQKRQPDRQLLIMGAELTVSEQGGHRKYYVHIGQGWVKQGGNWLIETVFREEVTRLKIPAERLHLYPEDADARSDVAKAAQEARLSHKRIILMFGNNTRTNCDVLEEAFKNSEIAPAFNQFYELVHFNIGGLDKNLDVAKQYGVPLPRGFPALAALDSNGELVFSQKRGEFANARWMTPEDILAFLNKWKSSTTKN